MNEAPVSGQAEERAFPRAVGEWLHRNPVCSPPGRCLGFNLPRASASGSKAAIPYSSRDVAEVPIVLQKYFASFIAQY